MLEQSLDSLCSTLKCEFEIIKDSLHASGAGASVVGATSSPNGAAAPPHPDAALEALQTTLYKLTDQHAADLQVVQLHHSLLAKRLDKLEIVSASGSAAQRGPESLESP